MIPKGRVIGLDLGSARIGVAVTDSAQRVATGCPSHRAGPADRAADHAAVARLVEEYQAVGVVVGLPLSMSGRGRARRSGCPGRRSPSCAGGLAVEVDTVDERLTTVDGRQGPASSRPPGSGPARRRRSNRGSRSAAIMGGRS